MTFPRMTEITTGTAVSIVMKAGCQLAFSRVDNIWKSGIKIESRATSIRQFQGRILSNTPVTGLLILDLGDKTAQVGYDAILVAYKILDSTPIQSTANPLFPGDQALGAYVYGKGQNVRILI